MWSRYCKIWPMLELDPTISILRNHTWEWKIGEKGESFHDVRYLGEKYIFLTRTRIGREALNDKKEAFSFGFNYEEVKVSRRNLVMKNQLGPSRETGQEYTFFGMPWAKGMDHEPWRQKESYGGITVLFLRQAYLYSLYSPWLIACSSPLASRKVLLGPVCLNNNSF